jgi:UDPglucose 6-dehydrogenase
MKLGVIGNGFVGQASSQLQCKDIELIAYDTRPEACYPLGTTMADILSTDIVMISVPTPMSPTGECHTKIVRSVVKQLADAEYRGMIVVRSTVPVGTCDSLNVFFMPEFLTEKNFLQDFIHNEDWIFGIYDACDEPRRAQFISVMTDLFNKAHSNQRITSNRMRFISAKEAEMIKLFRNCFLSVKISFCNEMYQYCQAMGVNYNHVREFVASDKRIGPSHTNVPGHDGHFGFGGTCFPKDLNSLCYEMKRVGCDAHISNAAKFRNETIDRPEQDWNTDKGRAVTQ